MLLVDIDTLYIFIPKVCLIEHLFTLYVQIGSLSLQYILSDRFD